MRNRQPILDLIFNLRGVIFLRCQLHFYKVRTDCQHGGGFFLVAVPARFLLADLLGGRAAHSMEICNRQRCAILVAHRAGQNLQRNMGGDAAVENDKLFDAKPHKAVQDILHIVHKVFRLDVHRTLPTDKRRKVSKGQGRQGDDLAAAGQLGGKVVGHVVVGAHRQMAAVLLAAAADWQNDNRVFIDLFTALRISDLLDKGAFHPSIIPFLKASPDKNGRPQNVPALSPPIAGAAPDRFVLPTCSGCRTCSPWGR